jgi:hypothetical protein
MCNEVIINGTLCSNHGELVAAIGGEPIYKYDDMDITPEDCLCNIDVEKTAEKFGLTIDRELSNNCEIVMTGEANKEGAKG